MRGLNMDYISEANKFMYDDDYLVEAVDYEKLIKQKTQEITKNEKQQKDEEKHMRSTKGREQDKWSAAVSASSRAGYVLRAELDKLKKKYYSTIKIDANDVEDFKNWRTGYMSYDKKGYDAMRKEIMSKHNFDISKGTDFLKDAGTLKVVNSYKLSG